MKIKRNEFLIFVSGLFSLGGLSALVFHKRKQPSETVLLPTEENFVLPLSAVKTIHRLDGLVFSVNRTRKTVGAHNEATGELVWESHGEDRFIIPGAAFPIDLSASGELWVANIGRKRLEQLDPKTGRFIASWEPKIPFGGCCNPVRFAALSGGRFITMEKGVCRACIYLPSGILEQVLSDTLSDSEFNYYLSRSENSVDLYDIGNKKHWEVQL